MSSSVFVGNLSFDTTEESLSTHLGNYNVFCDEVSIFSRANGRSKGCAMVTFASADDASNAINTLNDTECDGRAIFCREDRGARAPQKQEPRQNNRPVQQSEVNECVLFLGNLSFDTTEDSISTHLENYNIFPEETSIFYRDNGRSKGCCTVTFANGDDCSNAIATLNDTELDSRTIFAREDRGAGRPGGKQQQQRRPRQQKQVRSRVVDNPACHLFVGNLAWEVEDGELHELFGQYGEVVSAFVENTRGRSRGWGGVEMSTADEAAAAIGALHDFEHKERLMVVRADERVVSGDNEAY